MTQHNRLARRQRIALIVAIACAALSTAGLVGARFVRSPQDQAAAVGPPQPSLLTAKVERRVLTQTLVTRGTVGAAQEIKATPMAAAGQSGGASVVTAVRTTIGQTVQQGQVLLEVAGRPLIALLGSTPAYRDLKPNDRGADVAELQKALASLGHYRGRVTEHFDAATKTAVTKLYQAIGYDVPTTGGPNDQGDRQALLAAQNAVDSAQRAVDNLQRQIDAAPDAPAQPGQEPLSVQLQYLKKALDQAKTAQAEFVASTGPKLPVAEFVFVPAFPATVAKLSATVGNTVDGPLITLASGQLAVTAQLQPDQAKLLTAGMTVAITAETLGQNAEGKLTTIGELTTPTQPGQNGQDRDNQNDGQATPSGAPYVPVTIIPASALDSAWYGQDVRLTFTQSRTPDPVLVVPLSAMSTGADGAATVTKVVGAETVRVPVRADVSADGFVAITPQQEGSLAPEDTVVVGQ